jgi:hypothetical protein
MDLFHTNEVVPDARKIHSPCGERYSWQAAHQAAVLETDNSAMSIRIYEAPAAIEQRRLSYLEIDKEENRALEHAEQGLLALKAERLDRSGQ